ncbi:MAG: NAD(P)-dependent oxidoreductase [Deltaproteobacteria bacterium]|nr:NAD(P)-dependent oxidoreductase [Deltaproteobacteria bacterium]PWB62058.1 MAG: NAD(P)-dependent oxidoreductase [Deltaproteobacteria bacterium]
MIIVDKALEQREREGNPIRVGLVGAGYMGRGIALQVISSIAGMRLVAIANRSIREAQRAYKDAGIDSFATAGTLKDLEDAVAKGGVAVTGDAALVCRAAGIDAVIEATGEIEFGARVAVEAIGSGKHVILMNAELDATLGPILKEYADRAGVVITNTDGDEPGVAMNLYRFVKTIGYRPVLAGNLKGFYDPHRTPATQKEFAEKHGQKPKMITSFVDGTKLSMELTVLANATGFRVGRRGMYGPRCAHVKDALALFPTEQLLNGGLVDYLLGAEPGTGAFVVGYNENPIRMQYMRYFKMGDGPFYVFYTPFHLPHLEIPLTVARAVLFRDATVAPLGGPVCDVITLAKRDLKAGEVLDGIGGYTCYGMIDNADVSRAERLLPMGLSEGCRLVRDIPMDRPVSYGDVELPAGRFCDTLREEQRKRFWGE